MSAAFLTNLRTRRKSSSSTIAGYTTGIKVFKEWLGAMAQKDIRSIRPQNIDAYVTHLQSRYATATVEIRLTQISSVFAWAVRQELAERNPATRVDRPQSVAMARTPFTAAELVSMIQTAKDEIAAGRLGATDMLTLLLLGVCTGARLMDCAMMRWEDVDLRAGVIAYLPRKKAKSGQILRVAVVEPLLGHLTGLARNGEWVLPVFHQRGGPDLSSRFMAFLQRAGIKGERTSKGRARAHNSKSFHGLRHTLATLLHNAGVDDLVRRRITGHNSRETAAIYQHVSVEATGVALRGVLGAIAEPSPAPVPPPPKKKNRSTPATR